MRTSPFEQATQIGAGPGKDRHDPPTTERAEERLRYVVPAEKMVAYSWDPVSDTIEIPEACTLILGISLTAQVTGQLVQSRVHPHDLERLRTEFAALAPENPRIQTSFRIVHPERGEVWLETNSGALFDEAGRILRITGTLADLTARKLAETELAKAQRLAQVGSWHWEPETDTVLWSDELYRIAGRDRRLPAVSYKDHHQLYAPESWERLRQAVEQALRTGEQYELELELIHSDGTTRWVIARGEAQFDTEGHIVELNGTVQDITEPRRTREALRESEERLRLAAQVGRMYAYEWDRASDVIKRSAEFTPILGLASQSKEATCQQMLGSVHPDDRAKVIAATIACTPEKPTCRVEYRVLRSDGSTIWLEKNGHAFFDEKGEMLRMIGMVADITEHKLAQEAISGMSRKLIEAQEAERARIARDLHDDIGQRLGMLSVMVEQMKRSFPDSGNDVHSRLDEVRELVRDISVGIQAMSHELHPAKLRHMGMVDAMRGFCMELSEKQNVEIVFSDKAVPRTVPPEVSICLFRVLQEALHNAVKYSGAGHFEVELRGTSGAVLLTVRDSGVGFDRNSAMKGRGLGLTSMQERLKLVAGELSIESSRGSGTAVLARVPVHSASMAARASG